MRWTRLIILAPILAACGGTAPSLSLAQLEAAREKVHGFQPWEQAEAALKETLGEPTVVDEATWAWTAREGEACHKLTVTRMAKTVGTVSLDPADCP